jgi:hypothetical protein
MTKAPGMKPENGGLHVLPDVVAEELECSVSKGLDWLNLEVSDWANRVGRSSIRMMEPDGCMLHRLYGSY